MNHIIAAVLFTLLGVFILIDYFKDKKLYRLLALIPILVNIFFQTPLSNNISKVFSNILVGIVFLVAIIIFYLILKDEKNQNL
ncbi:hypothetical protein [Clostridium botulinum]|uniref:hypothetical protein n=1 Tax=Clostridium botulinum TaxID=1491 RepID=UPI000699B38D|nr:hypothetical protein [Clostridium botulinum]KOA90878.1 hypothetical protein ADU76_12560 [Clostridium botulinum]MCD3203443.1 hypothetical protein [Clostridium botulinum C/D]MCD3222306.1 hypothetical protein [Clostridium botulinum C/D]MCD3231423.1 hypothetical protein [Clostridium botulinum C/D]MCD3273079.1 hypothetical protein [Clostridium botulinum C/D]